MRPGSTGDDEVVGLVDQIGCRHRSLPAPRLGGHPLRDLLVGVVALHPCIGQLQPRADGDRESVGRHELDHLVLGVVGRGVGDEQIVHDVVDIVGTPLDGQVAATVAGHGEHPPAEAVDGGDGGSVELGHRGAQAGDAPGEFVGVVDPRHRRHDQIVAGLRTAFERVGHLDQASPHPAAQFGGGGLGEADDAQRRRGRVELGHEAHRQRAERIGLARARAGLEHRQPRRQLTVDSEGNRLSHRRPR
jgi:hypothetical protein